MQVLVLNAGSSSQKSRLYTLGDALPAQPPTPLWSAEIGWTEREGTAQLSVHTSAGAKIEEERPATSHADLLRTMLETLWTGPTRVLDGPHEIDVVGHRVVHGGRDYRQSVRITPEVQATIERLGKFAPEHNPVNLEGIVACERLFGAVPQVAVFDTAFHATLPEAAAVYPGPYEWYEQQNIQRYGFHGISHQYCAERAAQVLGRDLASLRLITCHLGNGCSLAAIAGGRSVDTTMGFTPLDGLMMGSRSGAVDPGILTYLLRQPGASAERLEETLNRASGLAGISGVSNDMREVLEARAHGNPRATLALDMYVHRLRNYIGAMLATLGGVDALVFAGGVGEHAASVRAAACEAFGFIGLKLDAERNTAASADRDISAAESRVRVLVIHTEEDWMIARDAWHLLHA